MEPEAVFPFARSHPLRGAAEKHENHGRQESFLSFVVLGIGEKKSKLLQGGS
jgi:hypothetical protein